MNAIIILRETHTAQFRGFFPKTHPALIPVCNKPLLDYLIDFTVLNGSNRISLVLEDPDPSIPLRYGNGDRWGISISYETISAGTAVDRIINTHQDIWKNTPVMVMDGFFFIHYNQNGPAILLDRKTPTGFLAGCATGSLILTHSLDRIRNLSKAPTDLPFALAGMEGLGDLYAVSMEIMGAQQAHYVLPGYKQDNRIIQGKNVIIHPKADLRGPVILGDHTRIREDAEIGPYAVLGDRVMIDKGSQIRQAMVCPNSYVGRNLNLHHSIANQTRIFNAGLNSTDRITDPTRLSSLGPSPLSFGSLPNWLNQLNPFKA